MITVKVFRGTARIFSCSQNKFGKRLIFFSKFNTNMLRTSKLRKFYPKIVETINCYNLKLSLPFIFTLNIYSYKEYLFNFFKNINI